MFKKHIEMSMFAVKLTIYKRININQTQLLMKCMKY